MKIDAVRARFPALKRQIGGQNIAYFDGPGGTQVPDEVIEAMRMQMVERNANAGWNYPASHAVDAMMGEARAAFAALYGARAEEIVFGANMTTLTLRLAHALGRRWTAGDELVVTELDHHANVDTWRMLEQDRGVVIRVARMRPEDGTLDLEDLEAKLNRRTRLLAIGAASNALGTMPDVARAARAAHDVGALVFVDAVHYAAHERVDVRALGADILVGSAYKFYGPHMGAAYVRDELLLSLDVPRIVTAPNDGPSRLETGTPNFECIAGGTAAARFLAQEALPLGHERGAQLFARLWSGLESIRGVRLYGLAPGAGRRTPTVAFTIEGVRPRDAAGALAENAIFVSHGDFYAVSVVDRLGLRAAGGMIRAGCAVYTTEEEVDRLVDGVAAVASREIRPERAGVLNSARRRP